MSLLWVLIIAVLIAAALVHRLYRMHRRDRYVDTPAWEQEHWQEEHERDKVAQRRALEGQ
jgi:hypothetical protein